MPTKFSASCKKAVPKNFDLLTPEEHEQAQALNLHSYWDRNMHANVVPIPCGFETKDRTELENHMKGAHRAKPVPVPKPIKMWRAPRLTAEGKPFEPSGLEPGATVTWRECVDTDETYFDDELGHRRPVREWIERTGEVWSLAPRPKSVWVVPAEPRDKELAILLTLDKTGDFYPVEWFARQHPAAEAVSS